MEAVSEIRGRMVLFEVTRMTSIWSRVSGVRGTLSSGRWFEPHTHQSSAEDETSKFPVRPSDLVPFGETA